MAFMGLWGTGVEPGTQYTEKVSCTVWKMMIIIIGYVCVDHNIIIIILGTFRLRPEYSVILVPFLRVVHISPTIYKLFQ